ncbi:MAG: glucosaminidase domain-containing protein, partial [Helicobacteraceae bacterium]|nr:glucosaminidase domain-containing protein [Candidatus Sulfurimonas ponti]
MNKNKIILASSFVLLSAILVYTNFQEDEQTVTVIKEPESIKTLSKIERPKAVKTTQEDEIIIEESPSIVPEIKKKKESFQTKYQLSILPENMSVQEKKQRFNELIIPAVNNVYTNLEKQYNEVKLLVETRADYEKILSLMKAYNAVNTQDLLTRLKPHPKSIAIAQAAIQSGWATSRFTLIANNLFGVWSFDENEPRIQANEDETIYVKRYSSLNESIQDYYKLLATSPLFEEFRQEKMKTNDPYTLIQSLDKYYKEGDDYATG